MHSLQQRTHLNQRLQQMQLHLRICTDDSSIPSSCLPVTEEYFGEHLREILSFRWAPKLQDTFYRCMMDMLLCEILPYFREECYLFYKGKGSYLKELYTPYIIRQIDMTLYEYVKELVIKYNYYNNFKTVKKLQEEDCTFSTAVLVSQEIFK